MKAYFDNIGGIGSSDLTLDHLPIGARAIVQQVTCSDSALLNKLLSIGLVPGTALQILHRAPFGGPVTIKVFSTALALRRSEARCIKLSRL